MKHSILRVHPEVSRAIRHGEPVVALESSLISHGLPWPVNLQTAQAAEAIVRDEGVVPATIAVVEGRPTIGLTDEELESLARRKDVIKASRRDLGYVVAQGRTASTTVAATMMLASQAGIRLFATGGIGGAHRDTAQPRWDVSADLDELARTPVAVVCAGAKSILDIPRTLEILETHGVPVIGFGTDEFPAFYVRSSGEPLGARVDSPDQAAEVLHAHWSLDGAGIVLAQPLDKHFALEPDDFMAVLSVAEQQAMGNGVRGKELTPYLLGRLADLTAGQTLKANHALVLANARLAAQIAVAYADLQPARA
jgi:pseudouridine-5'-phosphate glycosidase